MVIGFTTQVLSTGVELCQHVVAQNLASNLVLGWSSRCTLAHTNFLELSHHNQPLLGAWGTVKDPQSLLKLGGTSITWVHLHGKVNLAILGQGLASWAVQRDRRLSSGLLGAWRQDNFGHGRLENLINNLWGEFTVHYVER